MCQYKKQAVYFAWCTHCFFTKCMYSASSQSNTTDISKINKIVNCVHTSPIWMIRLSSDAESLSFTKKSFQSGEETCDQKSDENTVLELTVSKLFGVSALLTCCSVVPQWWMFIWMEFVCVWRVWRNLVFSLSLLIRLWPLNFLFSSCFQYVLIIGF